MANGTQIDYSNPLARGLLVAENMAIPKGIRGANYNLVGTVKGIASRVNSTNSGEYISSNISGKSAVTIFVLYNNSNVNANTGIATSIVGYDSTDGYSNILGMYIPAWTGGVNVYCTYTANSGNTSTAYTSIPSADNKFYALGWSVNPGSNNGIIYKNGLVDNNSPTSTLTNGDVVTSNTNNKLSIGSSYSYPQFYCNKYILLVAVWCRELSALEHLSLANNPWQLFQPLYNPIFVGLSVAISNITLVGTSSDTASTSSVDVITTGVYCNLDITSTGWHGIPNNTNKYSNIDEVTASTSDYIMSPNIYDAGMGPLILGLNNTLASGTWEIRVEAKYSSATSDVKFTLLDSSNNPVGNSGWIPVSNTYVTYTPNITTTGTASRLQIEVR